MRDHQSGWTATITLALTLATAAAAEVPPVFERHAEGAGFTFLNVPRPAVDDAAATAEFRLLDGEPDGNAGALDVLHDGRLPGTRFTRSGWWRSSGIRIQRPRTPHPRPRGRGYLSGWRAGIPHPPAGARVDGAAAAPQPVSLPSLPPHTPPSANHCTL